MRYGITLFYMDDKEVDVTISVENVNSFMTAIGNNEVYFDSDKEAGIWLPIDKIRYFTIKKPNDGEK